MNSNAKEIAMSKHFVRLCRLAGVIGLAPLPTLPMVAMAQPVSAKAPSAVSWYGDPSAPDISGVWVRNDVGAAGKAKLCLPVRRPEVCRQRQEPSPGSRPVSSQTAASGVRWRPASAS